MQHLDNEAIARVASWLSSQQEAAQAWRHVEQCAECAARIEAAWAEVDASTYVPPEEAEKAPPEDARQEHASPVETSAAPLVRGTSVGRYLLLDPVGAGGMGIVYAAYDPELNRKVALKLLKPRGGGERPTQARLLREAQAMAQVAHPNVTAIYDVGMLGDQVFIAMEFVQGKTLEGWLSEWKGTWRDVLDVMIAAGRGLSAAHAAGLVHRDFKPENVLVGEDGRVRVTDFGLARLTEVEAQGRLPGEGVGAANGGAWLSSRLTHAGAVVGTPLYMAPEQYLAKSPDARSDQFSFCTTLYYALYGARPFDPRELSAGRGAIQPPPRQPRVPTWIKQALMRGLSLRPEQRFGSMKELLDRLSRPPAMTRWVPVAVLVALVVALGGLVSRGLLIRQRALCSGAEEKMAGIWDANVVGQVEAAFTATHKPFAARSFTAVKSALDRYAQGWVAMRTEACEATVIRGEQSPALLDLRMACLERRLSEVQNLVNLFTRADAQVVEKSVATLENLTPLRECADLDALKAGVKPPDTPELRARVEQLRKRLDYVKTLEDAGKYSEGLPLASALVREANNVPYRPLQAEALLRLGSLQSSSGDQKSAEATLNEAVLAAEAGGHDEIAVRAMNWLTFLVGFHRGRIEEGYGWGRRAAAVLERMGEKGILLAHHNNDLGIVCFIDGKFGEGLELFRRSEEIKERVLGVDSHDVAISLANLANAYLQLGRYTEALNYIQRALSIDERVLGSEHPALLRELSILSALHLSLGHPAQATEYAERALDIVTKLNVADGSEFARVLTLLGTAKKMQGRAAHAVELHERALTTLDKAVGKASPEYGDALVELGFAQCEQGELAKAMANFKAALVLTEKMLGPKTPWSAEALAGMGLVSLERHKPAEAIPLFERALVILEAMSEKRELAEVRFLLARALWDGGGNRGRAIHLAEQARDRYVAIGTPDERSEIARWLQQHGRP